MQETACFSCGGKADTWGLHFVWGAPWVPGCSQDPGNASQTHSLARVLEVGSYPGACLFLISASLSPWPSSLLPVRSLDHAVPHGQPSHLKPKGGGRAVAELAEGARLLSPPQSGKRKAHRTCVFRWLMPKFPDMWRAGLSRRLCVRLCTARSTWRRERKPNPRFSHVLLAKLSPHRPCLPEVTGAESTHTQRRCC